MDIIGLEKHSDLHQYLKDIELCLSEYENGKCSFEKLAINFRWCIEYILREYQKEYPNAAAADTFNTIKNLQNFNIIDRSATDILHQVRKLGNKGGAHLSEEKLSPGDIREIFTALLGYIPQFLSIFPAPSRKKLIHNQSIKIDNTEQAHKLLNSGLSCTSLCYFQLDGHPSNTATEIDGEMTYSIPTKEQAHRVVDRFIEREGVLYYNIPGITKASRLIAEELKRRKDRNSYMAVPAVAQQELGYSAIAYCCTTEYDGCRERTRMIWDYARPNKFSYFKELSGLTRSITLPPCFYEDAFDFAEEYWDGTSWSDPYIRVIKRSWNDLLEDYEYRNFDFAPKFFYIKEIVLPDNLEPACLSWLNLFTELEELVVPPSMYIKDGVIYSRLGNRILAVLRNFVTDSQPLEDGSHVYPGAEWGSGCTICTAGRKRFLRNTRLLEIEHTQASLRQAQEGLRKHTARMQELQDKQEKSNPGSVHTRTVIIPDEELEKMRRRAAEKEQEQLNQQAASPQSPIITGSVPLPFARSPKLTVLSDEEIEQLRRRAAEKEQEQLNQQAAMQKEKTADPPFHFKTVVISDEELDQMRRRAKENGLL